METRNETKPSTLNPDSSARPGQPTGEKASLLEDYIDILYAPSSVFARRANSGFGLHLLIISLVTAVLMFVNRGVFMQIFDAQYTARMAEAMASNPQLTPEVVEQMRGMQATIGMAVSYIVTPIMLLIFGLILWVIARVVGAKMSIKQSILVTTLASIPRILGLVAMTIQVAFMDTANVTNMGQLAIGPSRFMAVGTNKAYQFATAFDVFAIWNAVLVGIGIAVVGKVAGARAAIAAAIIFLLGAGLLLLQ
jgi:phosphoglycerol transferase MdoB-like AlkP superfamily enzyme